jgi:prephenate dehydrogenase
MKVLPDSIAVFGPGLMGGSLLMALRQRAPQVRLGAWARKAEAFAELESRGLADFGGIDAAEVAAEADLVVLCVPVDHMAQVAGLIKGAVRPQTTVTDVGSVKLSVVEFLERCFAKHGNFIGSHPMCGSEEAGLAAASADLYAGAVCVVTPTAHSRPEAVEAVDTLWRTVGGRVVEMKPSDHDRAAALVSHLPHIVAALLVELVGSGKPEFRALCAGGFRDTTRIASGSPDLWAGILSTNRAEVGSALGQLENLVGDVRTALENNDVTRMRDLLASAAGHRSEILSAS